MNEQKNNSDFKRVRKNHISRRRGNIYSYPKDPIKEGWIYVISNPLFPELLKIGFTYFKVERRFY